MSSPCLQQAAVDRNEFHRYCHCRRVDIRESGSGITAILIVAVVTDIRSQFRNQPPPGRACGGARHDLAALKRWSLCPRACQGISRTLSVC
jgi:hypothetical protein